MHPAPPSLIHLYPAHFNLHQAPFTSNQLISASTQLSATPSIFEPKYQIWAISPNLGQKLQSCPLWVKIGSHGLFQVLIPNPDFDFWNSDPKIHFWAILGSRSQLSVLSENWHVWYLKDADCYSNINFLKFQP